MEGVRSSSVGRLFVRVLRLNIPFVSKAFRVLLGSDIYCDVPPDLLLPHPYGIVIHPGVRLGRDVVVMQQVTIGQRSPGDLAVPVIGDRVFLGAGCRVFGGITVGDDAVIGANAVVTRDVAPGATVVGANRVLP